MFKKVRHYYTQSENLRFGIKLTLIGAFGFGMQALLEPKEPAYIICEDLVDSLEDYFLIEDRTGDSIPDLQATYKHNGPIKIIPGFIKNEQLYFGNYCNTE